MTGTAHPETSALISAVRRQLWFQAAASASGRHLRSGAAMLLAASLYHLFASPLNSALAVAVALLPLLLGMMTVLLRRRPHSATAARTADHWFDGKNLITSAWELRQRSAAHPATAGLLLLRAETAAAQWRQQVATRQPLRWPRLTAPLMIALTALFLLQLPSKGWLVPSPVLPPFLEAGRSAAPATASNGIAAAPTASPPPAPAVEHEDAAANGASSPQTAATASNSSQPPAQAGTTKDNNDTSKSASPPSPHAAVASLNDGGTKAGDQEGIRAGRAPEGESAALKVDEHAVERQAGTGGRSGAGRELAGSAPAHRQGPITTSAIPAAQRSHTPYHGDYTPALKSYMARYFHALNRQEEQP